MAMRPLRAYRGKPEVTHNELGYIQSDYLSVAHPYSRTYTFTHTHWTCYFVHAQIHISHLQQKHMTVNNIL